MIQHVRIVRVFRLESAIRFVRLASMTWERGKESSGMWPKGGHLFETRALARSPADRSGRAAQRGCSPFSSYQPGRDAEVPNPAAQRAGASRFAQKQINYQRRLAPVADLCVRPTRASGTGARRRQE